MTYTSKFPVSFEKKVIRDPSGDHLGPEPLSISFVRPDPSAPTE
jgi:hypothetical protein